MNEQIMRAAEREFDIYEADLKRVRGERDRLRAERDEAVALLRAVVNSQPGFTDGPVPAARAFLARLG